MSSTNDANDSPSKVLAKRLQFVAGVGPRKAELLERLNLQTVRDALFFFPRDWQDLSNLVHLTELSDGAPASVRGVIEDIDLRDSGGGKSMFGILVRQDNEYLRAVWFNHPFMLGRFAHGQEVLLEGKPKLRGRTWEMHHPNVRTVEPDEEEPTGRLLPVYRLTEGLSQRQLGKIIATVLEEFADVVEEVFPEDYLREHHLLSIGDALRQIHSPADRAILDQARRRFVYQELLTMQLALGVKRQHLQLQADAPALEATAKIDARIRRLLPFELTAGQQHAIGEITADMARKSPMNRLLQGDVGSGKTVVAVYAILLAVAHGYQAVMMAPTEVLARQHWQTVERLLAASHVRRRLLVGGLNSRERQNILAEIAAGEVDLVIGTQALLQEDVRFHKLAVAVIDEQHKFGVRQRASLKAAGMSPHYLVMTATPIPRTVGMTLYGDLDVSTVRDAPPGKQPLHTYLATPQQREKWWDFYRKKLREGRQGFVITPLVEASETTAGAEEAFTILAAGPLRDFRVGLVHGRLASEEKENTMQAFREHTLDVLVSTTVVEVGIDVPNACLLAIENGERFGLAALHQLRGRIGRGKYPGFCCVFANPKTADAKARLEAFVNCDDGFELAEIDFQLRGPGTLLGTHQHGMPPMYIADLERDSQVLIEARRDALTIVSSHALQSPNFERLRAMVKRRYGKVLKLGDVG